MPITKERAYKALAQKVRQRYGLSFDGQYLLKDNQVAEFKSSSEVPYLRFAEAYLGQISSRGGHPDYDHLAKPENVGKHEEGEITAFFMDLKNFTKYCLFFPRDRVYRAKAATIESVIAIGRVYSGHLHEIPGDGVLMYFGGKNKDQVEAANLAIQAACDAMSFLEEEIIPEYNNNKSYPDIFPKMGLDFGPALWAAYGANPFFEVKATAFNVDIAAKMMWECDAQEIKIGNDIREKLQIDDKYLRAGTSYDKQLTIENEERKVSYKTWFFNWKAFRSAEMRKDADLSRLGLMQSFITVTGSKSKLSDAPLA